MSRSFGIRRLTCFPLILRERISMLLLLIFCWCFVYPAVLLMPRLSVLASHRHYVKENRSLSASVVWLSRTMSWWGGRTCRVVRVSGCPIVPPTLDRATRIISRSSIKSSSSRAFVCFSWASFTVFWKVVWNGFTDHGALFLIVLLVLLIVGFIDWGALTLRSSLILLVRISFVPYYLKCYC
jgi:hypothetical protein